MVKEEGNIDNDHWKESCAPIWQHKESQQSCNFHGDAAGSLVELTEGKGQLR